MLGEAAVAMTYVRRSVGGLLITRWLYGKIVGKRVVSRAAASWRTYCVSLLFGTCG